MRRTVDDWLAEATRSADPGAVDRALARASELASACHELRSVLKAAIALGATGRVADLCASTTPHDPRLEGLATTLLERDDPPLAMLAASALSSMRGELWRDLGSRIRTSGPTVAQVLAAFR